jgi:hypothetical protein
VTATLDGVTSKGKDKLEPATEQKAAEELVPGPGNKACR